MQLSKLFLSGILLAELLLPALTHAAITQNLKYRNHGAQVTQLQEFLIAHKFLQVTATGNFFILTRKAVIAFQKSVGLPPSGYVGTMTREKINAKQNLPETSPAPETPVATSTQSATSTQATKSYIVKLFNMSFSYPVSLTAYSDPKNDFSAPDWFEVDLYGSNKQQLSITLSVDDGSVIYPDGCKSVTSKQVTTNAIPMMRENHCGVIVYKFAREKTNSKTLQSYIFIDYNYDAAGFDSIVSSLKFN